MPQMGLVWPELKRERGVVYLFGNARSWLARLQRRLSGLNMYRKGSAPQIIGSSSLYGKKRAR